MAATGYTPISLYYSTTGSAVPVNTNLVNGELAINITDGKLYYKDNLGVVQLLATSSGASGGVVGPASATDNAIVRFDGTTGKLVQNSAVTIADTSGDITGGAYNKITITAPASGATLTIADGKTLTANSSLTLAGTDFTTMTFPGTSQTVAGLAVSGQTFTTAQTFRAASAVRSEAASTQDAVVIAGRAGGTSSYAVTLTPATLASNTTLTLPNVTGTVAVLGTAQNFTAAQTFRAANAVRSEAASTQDAIVIAGRAGGTSSYAVTLTPETLASNTTLTLPNVTDTVVALAATQTLTNKTLTDPAIIGTILEDVYTIVDGAAFEVDPGNGSVQLITLGASRTPKATNFAAGEAITLMVDDGSAYTITWTDATWGGSGVVWLTDGGTAPTLATTGYTTIVLWKVSTQVYGARVGDNA